MELKIGNVLAAFALVAAIFVYAQMQPEVHQSLSGILKAGPDNPLQDRINGCIAITLVILGIVTAIRLVTEERKK